MYEGGMRNDKLNLLHNANSLANILVRTPVGKTESGDIKNIVIQGDVFGPIICSKQVDMLYPGKLKVKLFQGRRYTMKHLLVKNLWEA